MADEGPYSARNTLLAGAAIFLILWKPWEGMGNGGDNGGNGNGGDNGGNGNGGDNGGNGNGGGNGGGDNQSPTVFIEGYATVGVGIMEAWASASDPDGSISSIEWTLLLNGSPVDTAMGNQVTLEGTESGDYTIEAVATDDTGATASDSVSFPWEISDSISSEQEFR